MSNILKATQIRLHGYLFINLLDIFEKGGTISKNLIAFQVGPASFPYWPLSVQHRINIADIEPMMKQFGMLSWDAMAQWIRCGLERQ